MGSMGKIFKRCGCRDSRRQTPRTALPRLTERGHGSWYFHCSAPNLFGRSERVRRGCFRSETAARAARDEYLASNHKGMPHPTGDEDVAGKGPQAAKTTALVRYTLRAAAVRSAVPSLNLATLNTALLEWFTDDAQFLTAVYVAVRPHPDGLASGSPAVATTPLSSAVATAPWKRWAGPASSSAACPTRA